MTKVEQERWLDEDIRPIVSTRPSRRARKGSIRAINIPGDAVIARMGNLEVSKLVYTEVRILSGMYLSGVSAAELARELNMTEKEVARTQVSGLIKLGLMPNARAQR